MLLTATHIFIVLAIFILYILLLKYNLKVGLVLLLVASVLLHKQLFSFYMWDLMPIRILMGGVVFYILANVVKFFHACPSKKTVFNKLQGLFKDKFLFLILLLWIVRLVSLYNSLNFQASLLLLAFFSTVVVFINLFYHHYKNHPDDVLFFIKVYVFLAFLLSLFGFFQIYMYYTYDYVVGALWDILGTIPRVGSLFWDVNHFGAFLAGLLPVSAAFVFTEKKILHKIYYFLASSSILAVLFLTNSRTSWLIVLFAVLIFIVVALYRAFKLKGVGALIFLVVLVLSGIFWEYNFGTSGLTQAYDTYFHHRLDSFVSHLYLVEGSFQILEKMPLLGGGYGSFFEHFKQTQIAIEFLNRDLSGLTTRVPAHTIWGELVAETGILGLGIFIILFGLIIFTLFYAALAAKNRNHFILTAAMGAAICGYLIGGIFYSYNSEFFWITITMYFVFAVGLLGKEFDLQKTFSYFLDNTKFYVTFLTISAFIIIFWGIGSTNLIPWDEAIYAAVAKNMLSTNDFFTLYWWPDKVWFEKPPLNMWLMAAAMKLFGITSFAVRLPSAIFGVLSVITTFYFGKALFKSRLTGFLSGLVLITTFQFIYYARTSMLDVTVGFFILASLYFYWLAKERNVKYMMLSGALIGLGVLSKGVVGLLPFGIIAIYEFYLLISRVQKISYKLILSYLALGLTSILVFAPWHIYMYILHGSQFFDVYIGYHVLQRGLSDAEAKTQPFFWYLTVLRVSMRIWYIALLGAYPFILIKAYFGEVRKSYVFLIISTLFIFLFFSASTSKLIWYIIPLYPLLAIVVGRFLSHTIEVIANLNLASITKSPAYALFIDQISARFPALVGSSDIRASMYVWVDKVLKRNKFFVSFFLVFVLVLGGFLYLFLNKDLVYLGNLTGQQTRVLTERDNKKYMAKASTLYIENFMDTPLILFYASEPYEIVTHEQITRLINNSSRLEPMYFVSRKSTFNNLKGIYPSLETLLDEKDWVFFRLPIYIPVIDPLLEVEPATITL